ncbi:uncharacterized protein LOC142103702 [Mixophyes fleayi]|uniref:uncharacterized protein LOC142103702 n=1 Tax=Mixophyes fleayi TaxID=3061075 RepID=UPI003F4DB200
MGLQNFFTPWIFYFLLLFCGLTCAENVELSNHRNHMQGHNMDPTMGTALEDSKNHSIVLVASPMCQNLQQTSFVWTDSLTDRQFGKFRFGIGLRTDTTAGNKHVKDTLTSLLQVRGTEQVYVTVTAETNRSDIMLVIISCKLVSKKNKTRSYFIQDGCLDNTTAEKITREDNMMVFTLRLSGGAQVPSSSLVFISCEVKLCLNSNQSQSCGSICPLTLVSKQSLESLLETETYHVTTKLIHVIREPKKIAATNYTALVIGMVLGGTVVAVVVLIVRKSFSGVRRQNIVMDM